MALAGDTQSVFQMLLKLLDLEVDQYVYISQIFTYMILVLIGPAAVFVDKFGIRPTVLAAVCLFTLNGLFKTLLYLTHLPGWPANKMYYYLASCFFGTLTYSLFILLPLKVSETWFSASERSVAWTILMLQYEVGAFIASLYYPRLIKKVEDFSLIAYIYIVSVVTSAIICVAFVTRSEPDHPPSLRMAETNKDTAPFFVTVKRMLKHRDILLHVVHSGIYLSCLYSVSVVLQDILLSIGMSHIFAGNYMAINALVAIIMTIVMASFVHRVQNTLLACKLGSVAQAALFMAQLVSIKMALPGWAIVLVAVLLTLCRSYTSPHFNNMTAHMACGTVSQATIVGFSVVVSTALISVVQVVFASLIIKGNNKSNYDQSFTFLGIVCLINEALYQIFFRGKTSARIATNNGEGIDNAAYEHQVAS